MLPSRSFSSIETNGMTKNPSVSATRVASTLTLRIYRHAMRCDRASNERLQALADDADRGSSVYRGNQTVGPTRLGVERR